MENLPNISPSAAKLKHVQACLLSESQYIKTAGFENIELQHEAAAALCIDDISLKTNFLGHELSAPLMIAPMTGGMELGALLNERWAKAAHYFGLAMGVGSQRLALEDKKLGASFKVRKFAPNIMLFANLGAAQLRQDSGVKLALSAVSMIKANALFIHLNPLQEVCKRSGDSSFTGLLRAIEAVVRELEKEKVPVLVREVGFGLSEKSAQSLLSTGISGIDCSGAGGTSWAKVEAMCSSDESFRRIGTIFGEWGIPTTKSILNVRAIHKTIPLIASGGLRSGLDVAKAIFLGADLGAMAQPMLKHAVASEEALFSFVEQILYEFRVAMFAAGADEVAKLKAEIKS